MEQVLEQSGSGDDRKTKQYVRIRRVIFLVQLVLTLLFLLITYISGFSGWLKLILSERISNWAVVTCLYVFLFYLVYTVLFFPVSLYSGFILEHRFHLSTQSFSGWLGDFFKAEILSLFFSVLAGLLVYGLLRKCPVSWWIWAGASWLAFSFVLGKIFPVWILPLFYKIKPLADRDLAERLLALSKSTGARVLGVYEMDLSRKTRKANAMFAGVGSTKRIILGDTLISGFEPDEIEVVLAHELGHYKFRHIVKLFIVSAIIGFSGLYLAHVVLKLFILKAGLAGLSDVTGLPVLCLCLFFFGLMTMPVSNGVSRYFERQADRFALESTKKAAAFISAMRKLAKLNMSDESPPRWIEILLYDHPAIKWRVLMAERWQEETE